MVGLLDERPGRRGPVKLSPEVLAFLQARHREQPDASGAELASELEAALGVTLHRRTVEKALGGRGVSGRFWPIAEPAQADYEQLRERRARGRGAGRRCWRRVGLSDVAWPG